MSFIDEIEACFERIGRNPRLYQLRNDIFPNVRIAVHGHYVIPIRIFEDTEAVRIERVVHGSRNLAGLFQPEGHTGSA